MNTIERMYEGDWESGGESEGEKKEGTWGERRWGDESGSEEKERRRGETRGDGGRESLYFLPFLLFSQLISRSLSNYLLFSALSSCITFSSPSLHYFHYRHILMLLLFITFLLFALYTPFHHLRFSSPFQFLLLTGFYISTLLSSSSSLHIP